MNFGARWTVVDGHVVYENLVSGTSFDCGQANSSATPKQVMEFIVGEGDVGDLVFYNGELFYLLKGNKTCH